MIKPALYTSALERALGRVIADTQRQFEVYVAKSDALISGLQARVVEVETRCSAMQSDAERAIADRLASLRNGEDVDMDEVNRRLDEAIAAIPTPRDGNDVDPDEVRRMVVEEVAKIPAPKNGSDADPAEVQRMVDAAVAQAVSGIHAPEMPDIPGMVRGAVTAAVGALQPPEAPDVASMVVEEVKAAVGALPAPLSMAEVSAQIDDAMSVLKLVVEQSNASAMELRKFIPEPVDLTGYALKDALDGVSERIEGVVARLDEQKDFAPALAEAVEALRKEIPEPPDLSGFATKDNLRTQFELQGVDDRSRDEQLLSIEARLEKFPDEMGNVLAALVSDAVSALPPAQPGKNADPEVVAEMVLARMPSKDELRGPPGRLPIVRAWVDAVHYEGTVVTHRGATWQAACDTGRQPPHADWICLASAGEQGASLTPRGSYDAAASYDKLDFVMMNGSSFVAQQNDPGPCPGDGWKLLASGGGRGHPGEKGDRGKQGEKGDPGPRGLSPVALTVDEDSAVLTQTLEDGTELTADFYPLLAKLK